MIKHALCGRMAESLTLGGIFWCSVAGSHLPASRFVFAAGGSSGGSGSGGTADKDDADKDDDKADKDAEKKEKVTVTESNARNVVLDLAKDKKIDSANLSKCLKILDEGREEDKKTLIPHLQRAVDGTLNLSEFNKFLSEVEKKTPAKADEDKEKKKDDEKELSFDVKKRVSAQTEEAVATTGKAASAMMGDGEQGYETAVKIKQINSDLKNLNNEYKKFDEPIQKNLKEMVEEKQITPALAEELFQIDFTQPGAKEKWAELTKDIADPKAKAALEKVTKLKQQEAENDQRILLEHSRKMAEFREIMQTQGEIIHKKIIKEKQMQVLSGSAGVPLKPGQVLVHKGLRENPETKVLEETLEKAVIKEIVYEDIEIKDENNKVVQKVPAASPTLVIESLDKDDKVLRQDKMSIPDFMDWVDQFDVTEDIRSKKDLEKSIGQTLNEGDHFEYRQLLDATTHSFSPEDTVVKIEKIDQEKEKITLDQEVRLNPTGPKSRILSFAQFSKWYKRNEVIRPIENLKKLREEIILYTNVQNQVYKREPAQYPAIEVTEKEVLKYDDDSEKKFVIKEANDKQIVLATGDKFTPAAFLRWVKNNNLIKFNPEAEALKAANLEQDPAAHKKIVDETKRKAEAEHNDVVEASEGPPSDYVMAKPEEAPQHSTNYLRQLWRDTSIASLEDLFEIGKTGVELVQRKLKRWQHGKVGRIGQAMFAGFGGNGMVGSFFTELGAEFKGVSQHAENEEVNHHVEHYRTMGIETVKHELHEAPNKDILKAAITVLTEKGELRWDDHGLWAAINKHSHGVPCLVGGKDHIQEIEKVLDAWWGQGTFKEFRNKQDSAYNSTKSNFKDNAKRLENDPMQNGGLRAALQNLLFKHINGEYVNAAEYESYLDFALDAGKLSFEDKLYFLVMGIAAESPGAHGHHGATLLHIDRAGALEGDRLNQFPILDYFVKTMPQVDENGKPVYKRNDKGELEAVMEKPNINNFKFWLRNYCLPDLAGGSLGNVKDYKDLKPGTAFTTFIREEVLWDDATRIRMEKSARSPEQWDHDDMHMFVTILGEETIEQLTKKQGGAKQQLSNEGIKQAYLGLNHFTRLKMEMIDRHLKQGDEKGKEAAKKDLRDLMNILRSFIRFDSILDRRYYHTDNTYTRFGDQEKNSNAGWDSSRPIKIHIEEVQNFIKDLGNSVGLGEDVGILFKPLASATADEKAKQQTTIFEFGKKLEGELSRKNVEDVSKLFGSIQEKNRAAGNKQVRGILAQPETKKEAKEINKSAVALRPYRSEEIQEKVEQIEALKKRLAEIGSRPPEVVAAEEKKRLAEIYQDIDQGTYVRQADDLKILDEQIRQLQGEINKKESAPAVPKAA